MHHTTRVAPGRGAWSCAWWTCTTLRRARERRLLQILEDLRKKRSSRCRLGQISAASVIIRVPLVLLVLIFQRRIVAGLTAGAVRG
jgi:ABC-type glycerol-3-phosphate transport system permease component